MGQAIAYEPAVQSSPRGPGSRPLGVHHPTEAARLIGSGLHTMQILASFEPPKFRSEGRRRLHPRSLFGPCPRQAADRSGPRSLTIGRDGLSSWSFTMQGAA